VATTTSCSRCSRWQHNRLAVVAVTESINIMCRTVRDRVSGATATSCRRCSTLRSLQNHIIIESAAAATVTIEIMRRTVREILWGYHDELLTSLATLDPALAAKTFISMVPNVTSKAVALARPRTVMSTGAQSDARMCIWPISHTLARCARLRGRACLSEGQPRAEVMSRFSDTERACNCCALACAHARWSISAALHHI
jgi:hypothetical protein